MKLYTTSFDHLGCYFASIRHAAGRYDENYVKTRRIDTNGCHTPSLPPYTPSQLTPLSHPLTLNTVFWLSFLHASPSWLPVPTTLPFRVTSACAAASLYSSISAVVDHSQPSIRTSVTLPPGLRWSRLTRGLALVCHLHFNCSRLLSSIDRHSEWGHSQVSTQSDSGSRDLSAMMNDLRARLGHAQPFVFSWGGVHCRVRANDSNWSLE